MNGLPPYVLEKKIVIIGAGISGLTCAERLHKEGFTNVTVLEAADRIGGRLYTFHCRKENFCKRMKKDNGGWSYLEMGCQRVTGDSSLYQKARDCNQIDDSAPNYPEALEKIRLVYNKKESAAISILRTYLSNRLCFPKDFSEILEDEEFSQLLEKNKEELGDIMEDYMRGVYQWWLGMSYEFAFSPQQAELLFGYSGLLQSVFRDLFDDTKNMVISNKEVVRIDWSEFQDEEDSFIFQPQVKIRCRDDSYYQADHVVITIPLGYLKENLETLFVPPLPEDKLETIQSLSFVTVNKIFLEYENPFWKPGDVYHVIWKESLNLLFEKHKHESGQDPSGWLQYINRFEYLHTNQNTLCAWIWGEGAVAMEKLPTEEIACCCTRLLRYLTKKMVPEPTSVQRSTWYSNPYFRGSLVYDPSQGVSHKMKKISESVTLNGKYLILLFAGDAAFDMGQMSSVHGACYAGIRAAKEIIAYNTFQVGAFLPEIRKEFITDLR